MTASASGLTAEPLPRGLRWSAVALVLANAVPLVGVLAWGWSVSSVVILYWFENVVIGVINVLRMMLAAPAAGALDLPGTDAADVRLPGAVSHGMKLFLVPFFIVHYFGFCAGHGIFVFSMFGDDDGYFAPESGMNPFTVLHRAIEIFSTPLAAAAAILALSHAISFVQNYLIGGEFRRLSPATLMHMPYGRIVVLHLTILFGGLAVEALGQPVWLVVVLVVIKTAVDLRMHLAEHRKAARATPPRE
jgi:hypothetical protein